jgi:ribosomal protein L44E
MKIVCKCGATSEDAGKDGNIKQVFYNIDFVNKSHVALHLKCHKCGKTETKLMTRVGKD